MIFLYGLKSETYSFSSLRIHTNRTRDQTNPHSEFNMEVIKFHVYEIGPNTCATTVHYRCGERNRNAPSCRHDNCERDHLALVGDSHFMKLSPKARGTAIAPTEKMRCALVALLGDEMRIFAQPEVVHQRYAFRGVNRLRHVNLRNQLGESLLKGTAAKSAPLSNLERWLIGRAVRYSRQRISNLGVKKWNSS